MSPWTFVWVLLALALGAGLLAFFLQRRSGMPGGKVVAADSDYFTRLPGPLTDETLGLTGKPDYVVAARDGSWIPVEYKSSPSPACPYAGHVLQLAAYLRLIEAYQGKRPAYGLIRYQDKTFQVAYTRELEGILRQTLAEMRACETGAGLPARSHSSPVRCRPCGYRDICDQSML